MSAKDPGGITMIVKGPSYMMITRVQRRTESSCNRMVCYNQRRDCLNYTQKNDLCRVDQYLSSRLPSVVKLYLTHLQQWMPICSGIVTESSPVLHIQSLVIDVVRRFAAFAMGRHWSSLSLQHIVPE